MICAHLTIGGPRGVVSPEVRAAAAARAGFTGIGWSVIDYERVRAEGWTATSLRRCFDDHGVRVSEIEFLHGWARDGDDASWRTTEARLWEMAAAFSADHVNCGDIGGRAAPLPHDAVIERFAGICDRAADHGLTVALEAMPFGCIPDLAAAWAICQATERENAVVLLDALHLFRSGSTTDDVKAVPAERIGVLQLCDAPATARGDLLADALRNRRFPGEGELDLLGLLRVLDEHGVRASVSVEVSSDEVAAMDPHDAAHRAAVTTARVLDHAKGAM